MYRLFLPLLLCVTTAQAAEVVASGKVIETSRQLANFDSIDSGGAFKIKIDVGGGPSLTLKGDDNILPLIRTEVVNGILKLGMEEKKEIQMKRGIEVKITVPALKRYAMQGAGKTEIRGLSGERFEMQFEGAGMVSAYGQTKNLTVRAEGAGLVDLDELKSEHAVVRVEGVGAVRVYASETLDAKVDGIGTLSYFGKPKSVKKDVSGIGSVSAGD